MALRKRIVEAWTRAAERFGFREYDACVVESLDLLKRKSGEEIVDQIYAFKDKSGRDLALRPEMTPTLARMIAARQGALGFPLKWFCVAQCFRYERMTRGRKREHYQWNLDVIGEPSAGAEAEVLAAAAFSLSLLGLSARDVVILFSSRALLSDLLRELGIPPECHPVTFLALDKRGKVSDDRIREMLAQSGLSGEAVERLFELLAVQSLDQVRDLLKTDTRPYLDVLRFLEIVAHYGLGDTVRFDISVVRGLTYYTGLVFEAYDSKREFRAIFGGGRYDNLLQDIGGAPTTGVGLGFGDVVIGDILRGKQAIQASRDRRTCVAFLSERERPLAMRVAAELRSLGEHVDLSLAPDKPRRFFSRAAGAGAARAALIGPDDAVNGTFRLKNLDTREEEVRPIPAP